jgi:hypothetical protein
MSRWQAATVAAAIPPCPLIVACLVWRQWLCVDGSTAACAAAVGAAELRVAQLLGDPLPSRRPALRLWVASAAGLLLAFRVASVVAVALGGRW